MVPALCEPTDAVPPPANTRAVRKHPLAVQGSTYRNLKTVREARKAVEQHGEVYASGSTRRRMFILSQASSHKTRFLVFDGHKAIKFGLKTCRRILSVQFSLLDALTPNSVVAL